MGGNQNWGGNVPVPGLPVSGANMSPYTSGSPMGFPGSAAPGPIGKPIMMPQELRTQFANSGTIDPNTFKQAFPGVDDATLAKWNPEVFGKFTAHPTAPPAAPAPTTPSAPVAAPAAPVAPSGPPVSPGGTPAIGYNPQQFTGANASPQQQAYNPSGYPSTPQNPYQEQLFTRDAASGQYGYYAGVPGAPGQPGNNTFTPVAYDKLPPMWGSGVDEPAPADLMTRGVGGNMFGPFFGFSPSTQNYYVNRKDKPPLSIGPNLYNYPYYNTRAPAPGTIPFDVPWPN